MTALGKPCLFWELAISCPGPCCLHPEGYDMVENDPPASQHIPYLGNEHCVFAFPQTQEKNHRLFPNLKQVLSLSRGAYCAFPFLKIANDVIWEDIKRTPGWPIVVFLGRPPVHNHFLKRKRGETLLCLIEPLAVHSRIFFKKASWIWTLETRDSVGAQPSECKATPTGSAACSFEHLQPRRSSWRSQKGHTSGQMRQKNQWGQAARGANYTLSTAAEILFPGFSWEATTEAQAIVIWVHSTPTEWSTGWRAIFWIIQERKTRIASVDAFWDIQIGVGCSARKTPTTDSQIRIIVSTLWFVWKALATISFLNTSPPPL